MKDGLTINCRIEDDSKEPTPLYRWVTLIQGAYREKFGKDPKGKDFSEIIRIAKVLEARKARLGSDLIEIRRGRHGTKFGD